MKTPLAKSLVSFALAGVALQPTPAAAEASWADLILLIPKLILYGLPLEIAQFCYHLWPLMVGFAVLSWACNGLVNRQSRLTGNSNRLPLLFRPVFSTSLAVFVVVVAMVASITVDKAILKSKRFEMSSLVKAFSPMPHAPVIHASIVPVVSPDGRPWPKVATEFNDTGLGAAEYAGEYALEIENKVAGGSAVYAKLCAGEPDDCQVIRTMFIPKDASITISGLAARSYQLYFRPVGDERLAARSRRFDLPGKVSFYSAYSGAGAASKTPQVGNGSFERGDKNQPALIKLPGSMERMEFNPTNALFKRIRGEEF